MLAPEAPQTPRPRPPAQMRRSPSRGLGVIEGIPPPPYMLEFPSLNQDADCDTSDPVLATARMMGIQLDGEPELSPRTIAEVSQKSREELADLFLQAEKIIRARETELSLAANLGKTLLETNEALKLRHDALLSRLPVMQFQAASASKGPPKPRKSQDDAWATDDEASTSGLHSRASSTSSTHRASPVAESLPRRAHTGRICASPSALLVLSETNSELITELTHLRTATDSAQKDGARRLRKLEQEIGGLKAELDASQRINAELEERVKEQQDEDRKREREERLRKLRAIEVRLSPLDGDSDQQVMDFAPQGQGADAWDSVATPRVSRRDPPPFDRYLASESEGEEPQSAYDASVSSVTTSRSASQHSTISPGEYAVVAQLYRKVQELQEANVELRTRNGIVNERLARAERHALELNRFYDRIGQEIGAEEMGAEADVELSDLSDAENSITGGTTSPGPSLRSLRSARSLTPRASCWVLNGQTTTGLRDSYSDASSNSNRTGTRALGNKHMYKGTRNLRSRKPLTDTLFAPPSKGADRDDSGPSIVLVPARSPQSGAKAKKKSQTKRTPLPSRSQSPLDLFTRQSDFSVASRISSLGERSASGSSFLSNSSYMSLAPYSGRRRPRPSLGNELGEEFGADWTGGNGLTRRNSLFDDGEPLAVDHLGYDDCRGEDVDGVEEDEDPALAALRRALNPPYAGRFLEQDEHILPVGALRASPGEVFQIVSHAVAVRPNRWLETDNRRIRGPGPRVALLNNTFFASHGGGEAEDPWETTHYPDMAPGAEDDRAGVHMRSCRRERALERLASTYRASHGGESMPPSSPVPTMDQQQQPRPPEALVETIKRTSADVLIEVWIFLQFVVVICTFLCTVARRGPRQVLGAPPRRVAP